MHIILFFLLSIIIIVSCNDNPQKETIKSYEAQKATSISENFSQEEMLKSSDQQPKENPYKDSKIEVKTFKDSIGWGYDIFIDKNQYVHQPHIPAVSGNRGFNSENSAKKTGDFVAHKIKNNIMPPSITPEELDSLDVLE